MTLPIATTRSGLRVDLIRPVTATIRLSDIAEHLARLCRWCGAPERPYSVAQHSEVVAGEMYRADGAQAALYGLLHDAHEAYIGDITEPAAAALTWFAPGVPAALLQLRSRLDAAIHEACDLDWPMPAASAAIFRMAHDRVLASEMRDVVSGLDGGLLAMTSTGTRPLSRRIVPHANHIVAVEQFTLHFQRYAALAGLSSRLT